MKKWVKMLTMIIVGAVFLIGVTSAQAIMTNGTETMYYVSSGELTFEADPNSQYGLSPFEVRLQIDPLLIPSAPPVSVSVAGALYEFIIPNFYDPLPKKTVDITITGENSDADGLALARCLDVFGADTPFSVPGPALQVEGYNVEGTITPTEVTELWEIFPNPDFEYVKIWVPDAFKLVSIKIVTQSVPEPNQPPVANCQDVTVSTEPELCSANASIDDGSIDPDGDGITLDQTPPGPYELGDTDVTLTVTDDMGDFDTCNATVTVIDEEDPVISSVTTNPNKLWPPNLKMVPVTVSVDATDNCDLVCQIISVASNEPITGLGYGYTTPDWIITSDLTVKLRAERSWIGSGRVYTITVECADSSGNSSIDTVAVTVPYHYW